MPAAAFKMPLEWRCLNEGGGGGKFVSGERKRKMIAKEQNGARGNSALLFSSLPLSKKVNEHAGREGDCTHRRIIIMPHRRTDADGLSNDELVPTDRPRLTK